MEKLGGGSSLFDGAALAGRAASLVWVNLAARRLAKALASLTVIMLLVSGPAASGVVGGLAAVGDLVGLDGHLLAPGQGAGAVLLAWVTALVPTWNGRGWRARLARATHVGRSP